ncbi:hypothetical protein NGC17_03340 [Citrobacter portucalensis]|uniref:hypothetical protein n=1 Tax=Citrobacter portucalensis TaxID=1639133 RepID=UPI002DBEDB05|nr:hypothetical protein [Citrobacter portucalensis]MEB7575491.1 hypothetical protein [Citrobacter portucalensis]
MPRKDQRYYANVARQTQARSSRSTQYREFLERNGYEHNDENAQLYAMSLGLSSNERVNLVHELMSGF